MNQNRNTPPDPRDYDMYSAFRTKEKGEARRQQRQTKKSSYFDAYAHADGSDWTVPVRR